MVPNSAIVVASNLTRGWARINEELQVPSADLVEAASEIVDRRRAGDGRRPDVARADCSSRRTSTDRRARPDGDHAAGSADGSRRAIAGRPSASFAGVCSTPSARRACRSSRPGRAPSVATRRLRHLRLRRRPSSIRRRRRPALPARTTPRRGCSSVRSIRREDHAALLNRTAVPENGVRHAARPIRSSGPDGRGVSTRFTNSRHGRAERGRRRPAGPDAAAAGRPGRHGWAERRSLPARTVLDGR